MTNYYFLASLLPSLQIGLPPDLDFREFNQLLKTNLSDVDYQKVRALNLYQDILNLRSLWREEPLNYRGNYDENELEEVLLTRRGLPEYVFDFVEKYDDVKERLRNFAYLLARFFQDEIVQSKGFLKEYLIFERELRLVLIGLRSKLLGRNLVQELQYEDPDDEIVAQLLAQRDTKEYDPPERFGELKALFEANADRPFDLHKAISEYRFQKVNEMIGIDFFSIDRLLAYLVQLAIVEKWLELDKKQGMEIVDTIVKDAS